MMSGETGGPASAADAAVSAALALLDETVAGLGGGEPRPQQRQITEGIARAVSVGHPIVVQAPTGVGKSFGYLCGAIAPGKRVVVATATKALQDQLDSKDLPAVSAASERLGRGPIRWGVLKGRQSYACMAAIEELDESSRQQTLDVDAAGGLDDEEVEALVEWASTSPTGDQAELDFEPSARAWRKVSVRHDECPGFSKCPAGERCFAAEAARQAAVAEVVVVNIHLLMTDIAADGALLGDIDVVVIDEVHEAEEIAQHVLGARLSPAGLLGVSGAVRAGGGDQATAKALASAAERLSKALTPLAGQRLREGVHAREELESVCVLLSGLAEKAAESLRGSGSSTDTRKARALKSVSSLSEQIRQILTANVDYDVVWVEEGDPPSLRSAPLNVSSILRRGLWSRATAVLASATVPEFCADRLGADDAVSVNVASPFDHRSQSLLLVPSGLPDPRDPEWEQRTWPVIAGAVNASGGRALLLFTSLKAMRNAYEEIAGDLPFTCLVQGEAPKQRLVERFTDDVSSVLFATMGFWTGVDVKGEACFVGGTPVRTERGLVPIEEVRVGDRVWTHAHRWRSVTATMSRVFDGDAVTVDTGQGAETVVTPEHPLLVAAGPSVPEGLPSPAPGLVWAAAGSVDDGTEVALAVAGGYSLSRSRFGRRRYRGLVHNLSVAGDESYSLTSMTVHNCSLVVIDKLPFARPNDPLHEARRERAGDQAFGLVDLPRASTLLAQGVGRLIRSASDRGVVVVLDPRLATKDYRNRILNRLPDMPRRRDWASLEMFFADRSTTERVAG